MAKFIEVTLYQNNKNILVNLDSIDTIERYIGAARVNEKDEVCEIIFRHGKYSILVKDSYDALRFVTVATEDLRAMGH